MQIYVSLGFNTGLILWLGLGTKPTWFGLKKIQFWLRISVFSLQTQLEMLLKSLLKITVGDVLRSCQKPGSVTKHSNTPADADFLSKYPFLLTPQTRLETVPRSYQEHLVLSLKTCLKMRSRGQLHHHPLHRRIWKSGHKHTTCTWYTGPIRDYLHMRNRSRCNVTFTAADPSCLRIISFSAQHEALLSRCLHKTLERERERKNQ